MEKIFMVMHCLKERKLVYVVYMLVGEASFWWKGVQAMMKARGEVVNWENFKKVFLEKYFPDSARYAKEAESLRLQQRNMSIQEYVVKFEHLARYYSQAITEALRCRKFSEGLRYELKKTIVPMGIMEFLILVEKAKTVERFEGRTRATKGLEGSSGFRRGKHPQKRPSPFQKGNTNKKPMGTATTAAIQSFRSYRCRGPHMMRDFPINNYVCFKCGKVGHMAKDCNVRNTPVGKNESCSDRQKSYADKRRKPLEFSEGEHVIFKVTPITGVGRDIKAKKLNPKFIRPYQILKRIGPVAYQIALPPSMSNMHDVFHVSQPRKLRRI
uniref:CCHC-type domain-containing protein n=1 Tax=Cajanus cajan TaxID=3821 RepID=A0A151QMU7_CAJCA|nr:hypothetical protein KK1_047965 [Cajanus cajan]